MTSLFYCLRTNIHRRLYYDIPEVDGRVHIQSYLINQKEGIKIMKYLVESGADINCRDTQDQSVLDYAYQTCRPFATFLLLKYAGMIRRNFLQTLEMI
jgi:ankyrin repeat protein